MVFQVVPHHGLFGTPGKSACGSVICAFRARALDVESAHLVKNIRPDTNTHRPVRDRLPLMTGLVFGQQQISSAIVADQLNCACYFLLLHKTLITRSLQLQNRQEVTQWFGVTGRIPSRLGLSYKLTEEHVVQTAALFKRPNGGLLDTSRKGAAVLVGRTTMAFHVEEAHLILIRIWKHGPLGDRPPFAAPFGSAEQEGAGTLVEDRLQRVRDFFFLDRALSACKFEFMRR